MRQYNNIISMEKQTFKGFNTAAALMSLGADIKSLAKHSSLGDQELARAYHMGTHTMNNV